METSILPGKTRELNFIKLDLGVVLVDPPGYGYAVGDKKQLVNWGKMMVNYFKYSSFLHRLYVLIDSQHGFKQVDLMLLELLEKQMKPYVIVFTKCDKINKGEQEKLIEEVQKSLKGMVMMDSVVHFTSAK